MSNLSVNYPVNERFPLADRVIAVTRAAEQAGPLVTALVSLGASVVEVPIIAIVEPLDGGRELRSAAGSFANYDWIVFTSPNSADRYLSLVVELGRPPADVNTKIAVVGPGTAEVVRAHSFNVNLIPERALGEGLSDAFPAGRGRVLFPRAEHVRRVVVEGMQEKGWQVDEVVAYRTVPASTDGSILMKAMHADAIAFTSSSTVDHFFAAAGPRTDWPLVISIGPETTATLRAKGVAVAATAKPHTIEGLIAAICLALR